MGWEFNDSVAFCRRNGQRNPHQPGRQLRQDPNARRRKSPAAPSRGDPALFKEGRRAFGRVPDYSAGVTGGTNGITTLELLDWFYSNVEDIVLVGKIVAM